jgi:ribonuclease P protein component
MFGVLARARRWQRGPVAIRWVACVEDGPPSVAFSIGRRVGNAPTRNRLRRRLWSIVRLHEDQLMRSSAYLISVRPEAGTMTFSELDATILTLLTRIHEETP